VPSAHSATTSRPFRRRSGRQPARRSAAWAELFARAQAARRARKRCNARPQLAADQRARAPSAKVFDVLHPRTARTPHSAQRRRFTGSRTAVGAAMGLTAPRLTRERSQATLTVQRPLRPPDYLQHRVAAPEEATSSARLVGEHEADRGLPCRHAQRCPGRAAHAARSPSTALGLPTAPSRPQGFGRWNRTAVPVHVGGSSPRDPRPRGSVSRKAQVGAVPAAGPNIRLLGALRLQAGCTAADVVGDDRPAPLIASAATPAADHELRRRGLIRGRTERQRRGDYCEVLVARHLGGILAPSITRRSTLRARRLDGSR
jgi:hypothetical protein